MDEADAEQQTVKVLCVLHQRQVHVDALLLTHVHPSASGQCDSHRYIIRTDRYVNRDEAYAAAAALR